MHAGKSLQIALIKKGMKKKDLVVEIGITPDYISVLCRKEYFSEAMMNRLLPVFEMKASEFMALSED